jgi:transposase
MDPREERGLEIANTKKLKQNQFGIWHVPSQTGVGEYFVNLSDVNRPVCSCPDFEERDKPCKHIYAVAYFVVRGKGRDGSMTAIEMTAIETVNDETRKTYPQNWTAYNAAQTNEQDKFQELLRDLCSGVDQPQGQRRGRPSIPLSDAIFAAAFKVYSCFSGRRFMSDLRDAHRRGMISRVPHYNSIFNYLEDERLTPILYDLIRQSSLPLASVEVNFAVDSTGFSTCRFQRWYDQKYGRMRGQADWVKAHVMCGVKTNIITAVEIGGKTAGDSPFLKPLVTRTAEAFRIEEVSADKAYSADKNINLIAGFNATPYIPFKSHVTGIGSVLWQHMYHFFMFKRETFLSHYHKRSNIESTFSMLKRKFGDSLRSKTDTAMVNETLCKVLCHNLVVLIHEMHELGIETVLWQDAATA